MNEILTRFNYNMLSPATALIVQRRADEIKGLIRRTAQEIIEVGVRLMEVKALLPHGAFGAWRKKEFDWSERTAQHFMRVAEVFKSETVADLDIQPKALYLLAAPSTPAEARLEAIERAEDGEMISYARAKAIVAAHQENPTERFTISSQPTASKPIPPHPETADSISSSFGAWIDRISHEAVTFQNLGRASELATSLTATQRHKLAAILEFLQSVAFFSDETAIRDGQDWMSRLVQRRRQED